MDYDLDLGDFGSIFSVKGKIAVITGGSRGLGLSAASALLQAGAARVYVSSRSKEACDSAAAALNRLPGLAPGAQAVAAPANVAQQAGVQALVAAVTADLQTVPGLGTPGVDIVLANAGASWGAPLAEHGDAAIAKVLDLNVRAVFNTVREFAPLLTARGTAADPSRVLITASVAGLGVGTLGRHATFGYSASKAAAVHLARNLALELGPQHVTVNALAPGFFPTKMSRGLLSMVAGGGAAVARANPMGRLGTPADFGAAVVYLCARAGAHVNAATLAIDGGAMWKSGELMGAGEADETGDKAKL